jgi:hypothetical protein
VALGTIRAERAQVNVITSMTAPAGHGDSDHIVVCWRTVAGQTIQPLMFAIQNKTGFGVVIKRPQQPVVGVVAATAICAQAALVSIIVYMAVHALAGCIMEGLAGMAVLAYRLGVISQQRESCEGVIEADLFRPARLVVTIRALFTQLAVVRFVLGMATETGRLGLGHGYRNLMTIPTDILLMSAEQRKSSVAGMIEGSVKPFGGLMAVLTDAAVNAFVGIIVLMA